MDGGGGPILYAMRAFGHSLVVLKVVPEADMEAGVASRCLGAVALVSVRGGRAGLPGARIVQEGEVLVTAFAAIDVGHGEMPGNESVTVGQVRVMFDVVRNAVERDPPSAVKEDVDRVRAVRPVG